MIIEDFISSIVSQFKDPKDDERNNAFYKNVSNLAYRAKQDDLKRIHDYIIRTEDNSFPFAIGRYYKYAEKNGMLKPEEAKKYVHWNTCVKCGTHYSRDGRGCPKCRTIGSTASNGEYYPDGYLQVTEDCFYCTIFPEIKKNPKWMTFQDCNDYGKKQDPSCGPCQCKECCKQMMMYRSDQKGTTDKYKTGELAQPWLYSVDPLNRTVEYMVKDIASRKSC